MMFELRERHLIRPIIVVLIAIAVLSGVSIIPWSTRAGVVRSKSWVSSVRQDMVNQVPLNDNDFQFAVWIETSTGEAVLLPANLREWNAMDVGTRYETTTNIWGRILSVRATKEE